MEQVNLFFIENGQVLKDRPIERRRSVNRNRFIVGFLRYRVEMIFQLSIINGTNGSEKQRNVAAMREHLIYIDGLQKRGPGEGQGRLAAPIWRPPARR